MRQNSVVAARALVSRWRSACIAAFICCIVACSPAPSDSTTSPAATEDAPQAYESSPIASALGIPDLETDPIADELERVYDTVFHDSAELCMLGQGFEYQRPVSVVAPEAYDPADHGFGIVSSYLGELRPSVDDEIALRAAVDELENPDSQNAAYSAALHGEGAIAPGTQGAAEGGGCAASALEAARGAVAEQVDLPSERTMAAVSVARIEVFARVTEDARLNDQSFGRCMSNQGFGGFPDDAAAASSIQRQLADLVEDHQGAVPETLLFALQDEEIELAQMSGRCNDAHADAFRQLQYEYEAAYLADHPELVTNG